MNYYKSNKNLSDLNDISSYIDESIRELVSLGDDVLVELTLKKLSSEFDVSYDTLYDKYQKLLNNKKKVIIKKNNDKKKFDRYGQASRCLIYYSLRDIRVLELVEESVPYFNISNIRQLFNEIVYYYHKYGTVNIADIISYLSDKKELYDALMEIINMDIKDEYSMEEINDYIKLVNSVPSLDKIKKLEMELKKESDPFIQAKILGEIMKLKGVGKND